MEIAVMVIFCVQAGSRSHRILVSPSFSNLSTVPGGLNLLSLCLFHQGWLSWQVFLHSCPSTSGPDRTKAEKWIPIKVAEEGSLLSRAVGLGSEV